MSCTTTNTHNTSSTQYCTPLHCNEIFNISIVHCGTSIVLVPVPTKSNNRMYSSQDIRNLAAEVRRNLLRDTATHFVVQPPKTKVRHQRHTIRSA